ncbi:hypothetical protein PS2_131 [Serratia phage PS2]|uniref:Uncharacterized protein n=1 Tax=Serratia phage PS2 TaxID=1481112 RepID=A0A023W6K1_9CAUD|nr:hypothetical protein FF83_gp131 [Serratia phage PS2]AHY25377.1 hypothetical protein PS2_131 [Serratia phage PS2]
MIHNEYEDSIVVPSEPTEKQSYSGIIATMIATFTLPVVTYKTTTLADAYFYGGHQFLGGVMALVSAALVLLCLMLFMAMIMTGLWTECFREIKLNNARFEMNSRDSREDYLKDCKEKY